MSKELYANAFVSYIGPTAALIGDTSLAIQDITSLALTTGNFRIRCDAEIMLVTAVTPGTTVAGVTPATFTVTRAQEGTAAAGHAIGAVVFAAITDQSIRNLVIQSHNDTIVTTRREIDFEDSASLTWTLTDDGANDRVKLTATVAGGTGEAPLVVPVIGDFTWLNQGTATLTDNGNGLFARALAAASTNLKGLEINPGSTPWNVVAKLKPQKLGANNECGLYFRDSASGKITLAAFLGNVVQIYYFGSPTSFAGGGPGPTIYSTSEFSWMKLNDDGTNHNFYFSVDGQNWNLLFTESSTAFLGVVANRVGWHVDSNDASNDCGMKLVSWKWTAGSM